MTAKKTRSAAALVASATKRRSCRTWLDRLTERQRKYVGEVVRILRETPSVERYPVADALIAELGVQAHRNTVARTLKEMIHAQTS